MAHIKWCQAIEEKDKAKKSNAKDFSKLMDMQWSSRLEKILLQERRQEKKLKLPLPKDVAKLSQHLKSECNKFDQTDQSYSNYRRTVIVAEACLIAYNRRRPGELQAMK